MDQAPPAPLVTALPQHCQAATYLLGSKMRFPR